MLWLLVIVIVVLLVADGRARPCVSDARRNCARASAPSTTASSTSAVISAKAEAELRERRERRRSYDIRPLGPSARERYAGALAGDAVALHRRALGGAERTRARSSTR